MKNHRPAQHVQIKQNQLNPENIDYHKLALSLLQEGLRTGILSERQTEQIQVQVMTLLSKAIPAYTRYESSSVTIETAEGIFQSLLYCIDFYLLELSSPEQGLAVLQQENLAEIHARGLRLVKSDVQLARQLLREVQNTKLSVALVAYNDTINKSLEEFFQYYDVKFAAHDTVTSIDYPLLFDDFDWTGINYIKRYLTHLKFENELCSHFSPADINLLLAGYGQKYAMDYTQLLINISELILKNALFSVLIGRKADILTINQADCDQLQSRIKMLTTQQFPSLLREAMHTLFLQQDITTPAVQQYLRPFADAFCPLFIKAAQENSLASLIVLTEETSTARTLYYESGEKLGDAQLRAVIDRLTECKNSAHKADLIEREIHNIEDLQDVFSAYCIFGHEYTAIFNRMRDYDLAILASSLLHDSPLTNNGVLSIEHRHCPENECYWQEKLICYLEACDINRYKTIVQLAEKFRQQLQA